MKILIITPRVPYPPYRGDKLKIFNIAKQLKKNNDITILCFNRGNRYQEDIEKLQKHNLRIIAVNLSFLESFINILKSLFTKTPFQVAWYESVKMQKQVQSLVDSEKFDVVYFHLIRTAQYHSVLKEKDNILQVIDFTDAVSLYLLRFYEIEKNLLKKLFLKIEQNKVAHYERIAEKFHTLFLCSEVDKKFLIDKGIKANIRILKNGIDLNYFNSKSLEFKNNRIIFTGNMPYYANYDAAIYFTKEIFPEILKEEPKSEFFIVGQNPPFKVRNLASKNVFVTGFVKDIKEEYLKSAVNVAPMRFGAGTLNKVIESIALGIPVVASELAVLGLPKELIKYVFIAKNSKEFASKVIYVFNNPTIRTDLMEEGKVVISELLSWEKVVSDLEIYLKYELKS